MDDNLPIAASGVQPTLPTATPHGQPGGSTPSQHPMDDSELGNNQCWRAGSPPKVGPCDSKKSQAPRARPAGLKSLHQYVRSAISRLMAVPLPTKRDTQHLGNNDKHETTICWTAYPPNPTSGWVEVKEYDCDSKKSQAMRTRPAGLVLLNQYASSIRGRLTGVFSSTRKAVEHSIADKELDSDGCLIVGPDPVSGDTKVRQCDSKVSQATRPRSALLVSLHQYTRDTKSRLTALVSRIGKRFVRRAEPEIVQGVDECCYPCGWPSPMHKSNLSASDAVQSTSLPHTTEKSDGYAHTAKRITTPPNLGKRGSYMCCQPCRMWRFKNQAPKNTPSAMKNLVRLLSTTSTALESRFHIASSWTRLRARFPPASSDPLDFAPKNSSVDSTTPCRDNDTVLPTCASSRSPNPGPAKHKSQASRITSALKVFQLPSSFQKVVGGSNHPDRRQFCAACFMYPYTSQANRLRSPVFHSWSSVPTNKKNGRWPAKSTKQATQDLSSGVSSYLRLFSNTGSSLTARDEPNYSLPFGSPVEYDDEEKPANETTPAKSQAGRLRALSWFNTMYNRNSTPVTYKASRKAPGYPAMPVSQRSPEQQVEINHGDHKYQNDKSKHFSLGSVWDFGQWSHCLSERSAWCTISSSSSFLLTNGIMQVLSVPLIFAWLFYVTET